jgi:pimeloyl-ACP methyl ester carboxylesterase
MEITAMPDLDVPGWQPHYYTSDDGLRLFARDYRPHAPPPLSVLCMPGLTRNAADFGLLAGRLARRYRVLAADQRGRGGSAWDPNPGNYQPARYVQDMHALLEVVAGPIALIGTSLGGLMAMLMAAMGPGRYAGVVLNDIGPAVDPAGLARIRGYVGRQKEPGDWAEAIVQTRLIHGDVFPDFTAAEWEAFTRNLYREQEGRPVPAYDPAISGPVNEAPPAGGDEVMWPLFAGLRVPLLLIRGTHSDILAPATVARMRELQPDMEVVEAPARGHAPTLDEPVVRAAIDGFLGRICTGR